MCVFWNLTLAYLLVEYNFQPSRFYLWDSKRPAHRAFHASLFMLTAFILTLPYMCETWFSVWGLHVKGWAAIWPVLAVYLALDKFYESGRVRGIEFPSSLVFLSRVLIMLMVFFLMDPGIHLLEHGTFLPQRWVLLALAVTVTAKFSEALVFYMEKDLCRFSKNSCSYPERDLSLLFLLFREGIMLICLMPGFLINIVFGALWLWCAAYARRVRILDISKTALYGGLIIGALVGLTVRFLFHAGY